MDLPSVKNCGFLTSKRMSNLQSQARYTIISGENPYSFFILECISHNIKIIIEKDITKRITLFKKNFIVLNYNSLNSIKKLK